MKNSFKKTITIIICLIMVFIIIGFGALTVSADNSTSGYCGVNSTWEYDYTSKVLTIKGSGGINSYTGSSAPWDSFDVDKIVIGDNITSIGESAFNHIGNYTEISIGSSVVNIELFAFSCSNLTKLYYNAKSANAHYAFLNIGRYSGGADIIIGDSVEEIKNSTFRDYDAFENHIKSIVISDSVKILDKGAFGFTGQSPEYIDMGNGLNEIPAQLIKTSSLKTFIVGDGVKEIKNEFRYCSKLESITLGKNITSIGEYAFSGCTNLTNITIPQSVTSIGKYAFSGCSGLASISIAKSVSSIGEYAFSGCSGLESINYNANNCSVGYGWLNGCTNLTTIIIGNEVETIPEKSFSNCTGITNITIPDSVISIGERAFLNCTGLTNIVIPESVTIISNYLFSGCTNLAIITLPDTITQIGEGAFNNTAYYNNTANWSDNMLYIGKCLIKGKTDLAGNKSVKSGTTCIADSALYGCNKIITLTVPTSVKHIGSSAFYNVTNIAYTSTATGSPWGARCLNGYTDGNFVYSDSSKAKLVACSGLATGSIVIPPSTDTIGNNAFSACSTITNIYLPVNVTRIGNSAFQNASLSDVYYEGSTVDKLGISFGDNNAKITDATWHYNSKVTDMPGSPSNPDNPSNPENPDSPPSTNIPEANIINGNAANNQKTYDYKTTVTFTANVPAGGSVQWYVNGNKAGTDSTLTVKESTSSYTVKVVVTDKNGNQTMDEEAVTIKNGFFDKLIWFFVHLFNPGAYDVKQ